MSIGHASIPVAEGELPLTIATREGTGAAVVIVPSAFGVAVDLEAQMIELAADASVVVALDPFFRGDAGPIPYDDMPRVMARLQALDRTRCNADIHAAIEWVRAQHAGARVVLVGICFGGLHALLAAAGNDAIAGVVTWHGTRIADMLDRAAEIRCPLRLHFGSVDPFVSLAAVEAVREAFADHDDTHIVVHEGATHGFSHRAADKAYDARAENAGMDSVRELARRFARP